MRDNIMHHQMHTLDSPSVITFSTERPRMLVSWSFIAQNAPTESCRCTTRIPWYHQNPAYTHRILFALTAWELWVKIVVPCMIAINRVPSYGFRGLARYERIMKYYGISVYILIGPERANTFGQTTKSPPFCRNFPIKAFFCLTVVTFWLKFHRNLYPRVQFFNNKLALVDILMIAWCRPGDKPLYLNQID